MSRLPPRNTLENTCTHLTEENVSECAKCITTHAPFRNGWKGTAPVPVRKRVPKSPRRQPHEAASPFSRGTLRARRFSAEARGFLRRNRSAPLRGCRGVPPWGCLPGGDLWRVRSCPSRTFGQEVVRECAAEAFFCGKTAFGRFPDRDAVLMLVAPRGVASLFRSWGTRGHLAMSL